MKLSTFLNIDNPNEDCDLPTDLAYNYSFSLDPFQKHAVKAIHNEENVLVTAKTSSGKTLVGEYQIAHSLKKNKRVFYTTPIKSLSNQKFYDLKKMYSNNSVGIMTGDIKYNPNADIIVMTTEILRNLLYKKNSATESLGLTANLSLENLDSVIFDECHYINNKERGNVWEETMILLPREVNLVLLSATIDSADLFASWLGELKQKKIHLISTTYRIVPLEHYIICKDKFEIVMDRNEKFYPDVYKRWIFWKQDNYKKKQQQKTLVANRRIGGYEDPVVAKTENTNSFIHTMNTTIQMFYNLDMLPCLFFVLSRKGCENYASKVSGSLITPSESAAVKHIIDFHLHRYKEKVQISQQYFTLISLLERGVGFHHSGLLPMLKEIVEILFSKGLIKVLFATETFAVGLNMPTKTVVFTSYRKYDDSTGSKRMLYTDEYIQMAGRAGRRGKDTKGYVFYLPDHDYEDLELVQKMMCGSKTKLNSRMKFEYDFILKTVHNKNLNWINLVENSYFFEQVKKEITGMNNEKELLEKKLSHIQLSKQDIIDCTEEAQFKQLLKQSSNAQYRKTQASYEQWKMKHPDRIMDPIRKNYNIYVKLNEELKNLKDDLLYYGDYNSSIEPYFQVLIELEYMDSDRNLTQKGMNATEINEGNALLISELYIQKQFDCLNLQEILQLLSCFLEKETKEYVGKSSVEFTKHAEIYCKKIMEVEKKCKIPYHNWELNFEYIDMIKDLFNNMSIQDICTNYGLFEGNLTRFFLKLLNMVEELKSIAMLNKNIDLLEKLDTVKELPMYTIISPDSLYLYI
jgi:superfamily II RNA helicase